MDGFSERVKKLPHLGIGVSTEYGAADSSGSLDYLRLREEAPQFAGFLEIGLETTKGLDRYARRWLELGGPSTYHFLDINLDESEDFDPAWLEACRSLIEECRPAWLCGDAGLWHFGERDPAHMLLLPPVLTDDSASEMAEGIVRLRDETGLEVLPENPPGQAYLGDLHLMDFFARVCERADTGLLLDCAHLAIYQVACGHELLAGLGDFPLERVVEMHVAGGALKAQDGLTWMDDTHGTEVLPETWALVERVASEAVELRAVVLECERNLLEDCLPLYRDLAERLEGSPFGRRRAVSLEASR